ncbi:MAG TPA: hypothetical protein VE715_01735, partial [Blastocatellia bacterium]|nr:hypothetical protein [Blastocatellia bacterium]
QPRELFPQMRADMSGVVGLEIPKAGRLKQNDDGHHFAYCQSAFALAMLFAIAQSGLLGVQLRQSSSQSTKSCTMSISVLLFVVGISGANLSRFLPKKESL